MTPALMAQEGIEVHVLPATATIADVLAVGGADGSPGPDGVFFSNGPGDPATADLTLLREVLDRRIPFFGICFGNQLLGRALGFGTYKLKYGHRGINQPVKDLRTGRVEITAQNHGFAVDAPLDKPTATRWGSARVSHICLNDDVVERVQRLRPIAEEMDLTMAQLAVAWVLQNPNLGCAIIGASRPKQVVENVAATGVVIPPEYLARIDEALGDAVVRNPLLTAENTPKTRPC